MQWAHVAAGMLRNGRGTSWISRDNFQGNTELKTYAAALIPFARLPEGLHPHVVAPKDASASRLCFSAIFGFAYSVAAACALTEAYRTHKDDAPSESVFLAAAVAAWTVSLCSLVTDILGGVAKGGRVRSSITLSIAPRPCAAVALLAESAQGCRHRTLKSGRAGCRAPRALRMRPHELQKGRSSFNRRFSFFCPRLRIEVAASACWTWDLLRFLVWFSSCQPLHHPSLPLTTQPSPPSPCAHPPFPFSSPPQIGRRLFCGNFGLIVSQAWAATTDVLSILEAQTDVTSGRGGQSGGIATYLPGASGNRGVRVRVRPGRRQIISRQLANALSVRMSVLKATRFLTCSGASAPEGSIDYVSVFQGHTRFATSSMPSVGESHPHQWSPGKNVSMWRVDMATGKAVQKSERFDVFVTHNGDFDCACPSGGAQPVATPPLPAAWLGCQPILPLQPRAQRLIPQFFQPLRSFSSLPISPSPHPQTSTSMGATAPRPRSVSG